MVEGLVVLFDEVPFVYGDDDRLVRLTISSDIFLSVSVRPASASMRWTTTSLRSIESMVRVRE